MGAIRDEVWPSELDNETLVLKDGSCLSLTKKADKDTNKKIMSILRQKLELTNKQVTKEAKRCSKYEDICLIMFKKYREIANSS